MRRQDIYGKIGESGVSVCSLDDMKKLYAGFDLVRSVDFGFDDDQRSCTDTSRDVHEHSDRFPDRTLLSGTG